MTPSARRIIRMARDEIGAEIQALEDAGLSGGFMAWNAMCSLSKLEDMKPAFDALTKMI